MPSEREVVIALKALANDRRRLILEWLRAPREHFREQVDGDLVDDGVCGVLIAEKLGVSQPTVSEHLRILAAAGLVTAKRIRQWTFYRRDEARLDEIRRAVGDQPPSRPPGIERGYVIVSGAPGAGKSTLAAPLAQALSLPLFGKDLIKETLHDHIPGQRSPLAWTRTIGGAAMELIWTLAANAPAAVLEANFRPKSDYERAKLAMLSPLVEVYCNVPPKIAAQRYAARHRVRHPAHVVSELTPEFLTEFDRPVGVGALVEVDTTRPVDVAAVAREVLAAFAAGRT